MIGAAIIYNTVITKAAVRCACTLGERVIKVIFYQACGAQGLPNASLAQTPCSRLRSNHSSPSSAKRPDAGTGTRDNAAETGSREKGSGDPGDTSLHRFLP